MDKEFYLDWFRSHADWLSDDELDEIVAIAHDELMDREYSKEAEYNDSDLEIGFDPYLGCYTDDC